MLRAGIVAFVFALPLFFWPGFTDYNYTKCIVSLLLISILLILWGFTVWRRTAWVIRIPLLFLPVLGILLAGVLSLIQATNGRAVVQSMILLVYFLLLLLMIANVIRDQRDVRWLLIAMLVSGSLAALYGVLQYLGILAGKPGQSGVGAILSTMGNRNHLGGFLLYLLYPTIILLVRSKTRWAKAATLILIVFAFAVMLLVRQTGTQISFLLAAVALAVGWLIFRPIAPIRAHRVWLIALAGAVIALSIGGGMLLRPAPTPTVPISADQKGQPWLAEMWEINSGRTRSWLWAIGLEMLAEHPVTGVGLGNYKIDFFEAKVSFSTTERGQAFDYPIWRVSQAHSELVQTAAELGSVGLLMLIGSLGTLAVSLWIRLRKNDEGNRLDLLLLTAGMLAFLAHSMVDFPAHVAASSLAFIVVCGLALSNAYGESLSFTVVLRGWKGKMTHILVVGVVSVVSLFAIADLRANWLMERGFSQLQSGQYLAAESTLQRSLKLDFAPRQTFFLIALAQIQLGEFENAAENLERCMTRFLDEAVYVTYAELEANRGELDRAQAAVDAVLASHPQKSVEQKARYVEAVIAVQGREYDRALELLESLTLDHPSYENGFVALGQIYAALGYTNSARKNFETALRLIDQKLADANGELESGTVTATGAYQQIRTQVELLAQQREYVVDQLDSLP